MSLFNKKPEVLNTDIISSFLTKSEGLQRILEKETEYFKSMKIKQAELLLQTKMSLIEEIETIRSSLTANPHVLKGLAASEKNRLRVANDNLMKAAQANFNETQKAKEVNKLILEAIADAVSQSGGVEGAYGGTGSAYRTETSQPVAIIQNA